MSRPLLELGGLCRDFTSGDQQIRVLKEITLQINAGEMVAIVGASGSGKSTLMNILGCLDRPTEGSYRINGQEVSSLNGDQLAQLRREYFGFIFQRYHLMPHLDAVQNVEIPAIYAGDAKVERRCRAEELLRRLGLEERRHHRPGQLSGGQQQRVSIARALMNGGDVILADEPTGALDRKSGAEMMNILHELHAAGHTIILVTHDMQVAANAERIIEISDGEIVADRINRQAPPLEPVEREVRERGVDGNLLQALWGRFAEAFRMALIAMASHRMRTLLTMLGIIIGITSVVSVVALGQGARQKVINDISSMGTNVIDVYPGKDFGDEDASGIQTLLPADLEALRSQVYVDSVTPGVSSTQLVQCGNKKGNASINGVGEHYFRVRGLEIESGRGLDEKDIRTQSQVVVIDNNTAKKFFNSESPLGKVLMIGTLPCRIIGVTKQKESPFGNNQNLEIWTPYSSAMSRILGQQYFNSITVRISDGVSNQIAEQSIITLLKQRHGGVKDFYTNSSDSILKTVKKTTATLTLMISAIAVISLLVGGIGVMNIMLVSVSERIHEIGIRVAVGARQSDILQQFLIESVLVCFIGGLIGVFLSYGVGMIFALFVSSFSMKFSLLSILSAFFCSTLIGVLFGFLPARNAARLDPIEALARE